MDFSAIMDNLVNGGSNPPPSSTNSSSSWNDPSHQVIDRSQSLLVSNQNHNSFPWEPSSWQSKGSWNDNGAYFYS